MPLKIILPVWLALCGLVGLAWILDDPMLFGLRDMLVPLLAMIGIAGAALTPWLVRRGRHRWPLAAGFAVLALLATWPSVSDWSDRRFVYGADAAEAAILGRHFIIGYTALEDVRPLVERGLVGGLFITRRNIEGRGAEGLEQDLAAMQRLRKARGLLPLIVAADQEGGPVSHLSPPLPAMPALSTLAALPADQRDTAARAYGRAQGQGLAGLGITMDLSPVVDLQPDGPPTMLDLHTQIGTRAISADPATVAAIGHAYAQGLEEAGILSTLKHFPGLGRVTTDTHLVGARLDTPTATLDGHDWLPFRTILGATPAALMVGHVTLTAIDPLRPASQSKAVVQGLLRERWRYDGIVITDDLTMGAIYRSGLCAAVTGGLDGGVDLMLVSWDVDRIYPALRCALDALRKGQLDSGMLGASMTRLDAGEILRQHRTDPP